MDEPTMATATPRPSERIDNDQFLDSAWVARYTVSFANLYRKALLA